MACIAVAGNINHDRIWRLDRALVSGMRGVIADRHVRLGGGGFYTGRQLLALGHRVCALSCLSDDVHGRQAAGRLTALGFETSALQWLEGDTIPTEILLDADGERTILAPANRKRAPIEAWQGFVADAAYVNADCFDISFLQALGKVPLVVSQLPASGIYRPADIAIGSQADLPGMDADSSWRKAAETMGARLRLLIVTDGPRDVLLHDGNVKSLVTPGRSVDVKDTTGAGDIFAACCLDGLLQGFAPIDTVGRACMLTAQRIENRQDVILEI